jgi:hypothetical protein
LENRFWVRSLSLTIFPNQVNNGISSPKITRLTNIQ